MLRDETSEPEVIRISGSDVINRDDRIQQLEDEIRHLKGISTEDKNSVLGIIGNPNIKEFAAKLSLDERQARNVKALITGGVSAASSKYLSSIFGEEIAGAIGGGLGGYLARRILGKG